MISLFDPPFLLALTIIVAIIPLAIIIPLWRWWKRQLATQPVAWIEGTTRRSGNSLIACGGLLLLLAMLRVSRHWALLGTAGELEATLFVIQAVPGAVLLGLGALMVVRPQWWLRRSLDAMLAREGVSPLATGASVSPYLQGGRR